MEVRSSCTVPGSVEINADEILGTGAYGKVCLAKIGQLPCAAKLLHDTLFSSNDPGSDVVVNKFEQECQFLSTVKHPNIILYLGMYRDPKSQRPVLLMELMDESLTKFLDPERSSGRPLPYHSQVNICYDVALALSYLHSVGTIHRDLSSNNVLLIGDGAKAKVTDFGMSKLVDMNPRMTPLTQVPGTPAYMPPEALTIPPHYSNKLDCFSHGVLSIQIITKNFPNPGDAHRSIKHRIFPTGHGLVQVPEKDRRKKDIDLIEGDHPLLPVALASIKDKDTERPTADGLCKSLAALKKDLRYTESIKQVREQIEVLQNKVKKQDSVISEYCDKLQQLEIELAGLRVEKDKVN